MNAKKVISTVRYVAGTKPVFFLSEITAYFDEPVTISQIYGIITPELARLRLTAKEIAGDVEISRVVPPQPYLLSRVEQERTEAFFTARSIPAGLDRDIGRYLAKKVGKDWTDPVILERLRRAIVAQKDDYWKPSHKRSLQYTKGYSVLGYLAYHFPVYFMQTEHLLAMLARDGLLKNTMTILDAGTGPGVVPLAITDFYSRLDGARATVWAIERSEEHLEAFSFLTNKFVRKNSVVEIIPPIKADLTDVNISQVPEKIDLLIFSNVLNELPDSTLDTRTHVVARLAERLSPDGSVLIVEPADEENATRMRSLTIALATYGLSIHAPCSFIWGTPCTAPRCWSFESAPAIRMTTVMETLAGCEDSYRYVNTDIKYSYAVLRRDGQRRSTYRISPGSKFLRLSRIHLHVGRRVNVAGLKMSGELGDARNHVFKICDGTARTPVYAVLPSYHITPKNDLITSAPYGAVLELRNVLVRYNTGHDAYNLLVSRNTEIRIPDAGNR